MRVNSLVDTGAILALLDRTDRWHQLCVDAFQQLRLPLITSEAVLTELFHLTGGNRRETEAAWKFLRSGAVTLMSIGDSEVPAINTLMSRYWDRAPYADAKRHCKIDFADATLVHLAKRESLTTIFTVDFADFETYRIDGRRRFRVLPIRRS
jgi:predicted nucleic acid-binding protein